MAVYAVGDIQGCAAEFEDLLKNLGFEPGRDRLWLVGDLVNRGPQSLRVLRLVKAMGENVSVVLGNHDLHLLAMAHGHSTRRDTALQPILDAPDRIELLEWLQSRPVLHHDPGLAVTMIHAGLPPQWDIDAAQGHAAELERALQSEKSGKLFRNMYGNRPSLWREDLDGYDRLRFITNAFTRLRVCDADGRMQLRFKGLPEKIPSEYVPWFRIPWRRSRGERIVCGHWSALGYNDENGVLALDTGCVWGGKLTAQRIDRAAKPVAVPCRTSGLPIDKGD
jgi:bis(5'-nucleosyl)-tetraphosphatase (symmetrical)